MCHNIAGVLATALGHRGLRSEYLSTASSRPGAPRGGGDLSRAPESPQHFLSPAHKRYLIFAES